jgi:hypothetical protein
MEKYKLNYMNKDINKLDHIKDVNKLNNYKNVKINTKDYDKLNLRENGVEYVKISSKMKNILKKLSKYSFLTVSSKINKSELKLQNELEKNVKIFLFNFLKSKSKNGIKNFSDNFTDILIVESTIRNSDIKNFDIVDSKVNSTASWFHTDWWEGQSFSSMMISRFNWLKKLNKFGPKKYTEISNLNEWSCYWDSKYVELINVWIPFSETTEASPLVFSEMNSTEYSDIIPYTYKLNFGSNKKDFYYEIATRLRYNKNQKLYTKKDMKIGEAIIFKSNKTPHTAYYDSKCKIPRKSIEFRCLVFNFDREESDINLNKLYKSKKLN